MSKQLFVIATESKADRLTRIHGKPEARSGEKSDGKRSRADGRINGCDVSVVIEVKYLLGDARRR